MLSWKKRGQEFGSGKGIHQKLQLGRHPHQVHLESFCFREDHGKLISSYFSCLHQASLVFTTIQIFWTYLLPYMLPEILIMALIMLNEINLKLCGLYTKIEADIETITEGIDRNIEKGD